MRFLPGRRVQTAVLAVAAALTGLGCHDLAPAADAARRPSVHDAAGGLGVGDVRTIGRSVDGRKIMAFRRGDAAASRTVVLIGVMHGSEEAPEDTLRRILGGRKQVAGINLWVIPVLNPDGAAADRRTNADGVDLNRNFPQDWSPGVSNPGPAAASEPETREIMNFLNQVDPEVVISLHQPFGVVDISVAKTDWLSRELGKQLHLPRRNIDCGGPCHGTLTGWFNAHHPGEAITVEFPASPSRTFLKHTAVIGLLAAVGGQLI